MLKAMEPHESRSEEAPGGAALTILLLCFFLSGAAALVYEVIWFRHLSLLFGVSAYALTTVLVAYMAGLGLGALVIGKWGGRIRRPLRAYALLEAIIGLYGALSPLGFAWIRPIYVHLYQSYNGPFPVQVPVLFFLSLGVLILPTVLMGATLPLLVSALRKRAPVRTIGLLYFINTLGGMAGTALAGYFLIWRFGMPGATGVAVALNFLAALGALALERMMPQPAATEAPVDRPMAPSECPVGRWTVMAAVFLSGFTAMVYEVVWTRLVSLFVGASTYAFTTILVVLLFGIALGSLAVGGWAERTRRPVWMLAIIQGTIAILVWASCPLLDRGHALILYASLFAGNKFWNFQLAEFLMVAAVVLVPAILMGASFPSASRLYLGHGGGAARTVGVLYAANTLGAICGTLTGGFVFLAQPGIGSQKALIIGGAINLAVAGLMLRPRWGAFLWLGIGLLTALAAAGLPAWQRDLLASGVYNRVEYLKYQLHRRNVDALLSGRPLQPLDMNSLRQELNKEKLLLFAEGPDATVTVTEQPVFSERPRKFLRINGKCEATSAFCHDLPAQVLAAQFGMCSHPDPRRVAIIGLGSGVSLGSILTHPETASAQCLEISPCVVKAARLFGEVNGRALDNPRARLILNDGRIHFMATAEKYDLIISEPTNPWVAGVANLFTLEHFRNCRDRLAPGGRVCQWFHLYGTTPELMRIHLRTFLEVFPHAVLWICREDIFLVGSPEPWTLDRRVVENHWREPAVKSDLARIEMRTPDDFMASLLLTEEGIRAFAGHGRLNTDSHPIIEFLAPTVIYDGCDPEEMLNILKACKR
jgi:spermidine synthase